MLSRLALPALACAALAAPLVAQSPHRGAFVVRLGRDTIAVERFSRAGNDYQVEQALPNPSARLFHTHIALTGTGDVASVFYMQHRIDKPDAPLLASTQIRVTGDSVTLLSKRGDSTLAPRRLTVSGGALPTLPLAFLPYELASMRARALKQDSLRVQLLGPNGRAGLAVTRAGADTVLFVLDGGVTWRAKVDAEGKLLGLHAPGTTFQIALERVPDADVTAIAARWANGPAMGALSPADSTAITVGGARVAVRYGRPARRGRVVFGDSGVALEPWGKVWRTGANEATRLTIDRDVVIGGAPVPAGTYTLWTQLDRGGWKLVVNRQTTRPDASGRPLWGTMYDPQHDLVRVPMRMTRLSAPVEQMRIVLEPRGGGAVLRVEWETTGAEVAVRSR